MGNPWITRREQRRAEEELKELDDPSKIKITGNDKMKRKLLDAIKQFRDARKSGN